MKKYLAIVLCICSLCTLPVTALAADIDYTTDIFSYTEEEWKVLYGIPEPRPEDYENESQYTAALNHWYEEFSLFKGQMIQTEYARQAEEAARLAEEEAAHQAAEEQASAGTTSEKPIESAGSNNGNGSQSVEDDAVSKYPVGSYVDPAGVVWSPDGTRLSLLSAEDMAQTPGQSEDDPLLSGELANQTGLPADADPDTLAVIAGLVSDIATDPPTWYVEDLRPADTPPTVLDGLKALVTSIFGEYTPVTTTSVVTETVGNDTHQYLVETVAPGAAGVDYEWVAGVFLFGIMLFCLMKLIGGVLK